MINSKYRYHHIENVWIYVQTSDKLSQNSVLSEVEQFSIVVISKDFNPEKYETLTKIFVKIYLKTGEIQRLLSYYLSVLINGSFSVTEDLHNNCQKFNFEDYDDLEVIHSKSGIKSVIKMFGLDIILIYTALILKKRVAVYHHRLDTLIQFIRVLPTLVWHRKDCYQSLYPCVDINCPQELNELQSHNHFIAGFLESDVENRTDLYDIYVNLAAVEITVNHTSKEVFQMTKTHKEIAVFMTRQADNPSNSDVDVIQQICDKNLELIKNLKLMANIAEESDKGTDSQKVTLEAIKEKKLNHNLENFLWNLAVAENMV